MRFNVPSNQKQVPVHGSGREVTIPTVHRRHHLILIEAGPRCSGRGLIKRPHLDSSHTFPCIGICCSINPCLLRLFPGTSAAVACSPTFRTGTLEPSTPTGSAHYQVYQSKGWGWHQITSDTHGKVSLPCCCPATRRAHKCVTNISLIYCFLTVTIKCHQTVTVSYHSIYFL